MMETEVSHTAERVNMTCCRWHGYDHSTQFHFDNQIQCYNGLHFYMLVITLHWFVQTAVHTTKYIKDQTKHKRGFSSDLFVSYVTKQRCYFQAKESRLKDTTCQCQTLINSSIYTKRKTPNRRTFKSQLSIISNNWELLNKRWLI